MDFAGTLVQDIDSLPKFWWVWLIATGIVAAIICKARKISSVKTVWISLLAAYILFILFETLIGRRTTVHVAEWEPFWSYSHPELHFEIIFNYVLFIPLGILLYGAFGSRFGLKVVLIGIGLSVAIELTQLVAHIGLFEFDDIIGNSIGCLIGVLLEKAVVYATRSYSSNCKQRREP